MEHISIIICSSGFDRNVFTAIIKRFVCVVKRRRLFNYSAAAKPSRAAVVCFGGGDADDQHRDLRHYRRSHKNNRLYNTKCAIMNLPANVV